MTAVEIHHDEVQHGLNRDQVELVKRTIAKGVTTDELALFVQVCNRTGLDPFARQIYAISRFDKREGRDVMSIQVSIDGARLTAQRSGHYRGQLGPEWCGPDGVWRDAWLSAEPPAAARVGVLRDDFDAPLWSVARFGSYAQRSATWSAMPEVMIAKCSEMLSLRRAFPAELSGLYSAEEMGQATSEALPEHKPTVLANAATHVAIRAAIKGLSPDALGNLQKWWIEVHMPPISKADRLSEAEANAVLAALEDLEAEPVVTNLDHMLEDREPEDPEDEAYTDLQRRYLALMPTRRKQADKLASDAVLCPVTAAVDPGEQASWSKLLDGVEAEAQAQYPPFPDPAVDGGPS
jgi:phage recombination protein Bet